jgi:hypothetical protein
MNKVKYSSYTAGLKLKESNMQKNMATEQPVMKVHVRIQCALLGKAERRFSTNCQQKQEMILRAKKWKIPWTGR